MCHWPSVIRHMFGVKAAGEEAEEPAMLWSHKLRGFRDGFIPGYVSAQNHICLADRIAQNAKKAAANVTIIITFLLSNMSDNFPIGHCEIAPDIASKKVTKEI